MNEQYHAEEYLLCRQSVICAEFDEYIIVPECTCVTFEKFMRNFVKIRTNKMYLDQPTYELKNF